MNPTLITILLIVNAIVCVFVTKRLSSKKIVGRLRIDRSDPEDGPYMFAEIFKGVGDISKMKYVRLFGRSILLPLVCRRLLS